MICVQKNIQLTVNCEKNNVFDHLCCSTAFPSILVRICVQVQLIFHLLILLLKTYILPSMFSAGQTGHCCLLVPVLLETKQLPIHPLEGSECSKKVPHLEMACPKIWAKSSPKEGQAGKKKKPKQRLQQLKKKSSTVERKRRDLEIHLRNIDDHDSNVKVRTRNERKSPSLSIRPSYGLEVTNLSD